MSETPAPPATPKRGGIAVPITFTIAVVLAVAGIWYAIWYNSDDQQAKRACETYISDQVLTSPASAKYSGEQFIDAGIEPEVFGNVDSQNSYGAMIRSRFRCSMEKVGGDWTVTTGHVF